MFPSASAGPAVPSARTASAALSAWNLRLIVAPSVRGVRAPPANAGGGSADCASRAARASEGTHVDAALERAGARVAPAGATEVQGTPVLRRRARTRRCRPPRLPAYYARVPTGPGAAPTARRTRAGPAR